MVVSPPVTGEGQLLVCGGGPSLLDDFKMARRLYPDSRIMAVNYAARVLGRADMVFTAEPLQAERMRFKDKPLHVLPTKGEPAPETADHVWQTHPIVPAMSSGGAAALAGKAMGFGPVVLCGIGVEANGHVEGYTGYAPGPEDGEWGKEVGWRQAVWLAFHESGLLQGVVSMSGYTRRLLESVPDMGEACSAA